jgi:hypothetical protein
MLLAYSILVESSHQHCYSLCQFRYDLLPNANCRDISSFHFVEWRGLFGGA